VARCCPTVFSAGMLCSHVRCPLSCPFTHTHGLHRSHETSTLCARFVALHACVLFLPTPSPSCMPSLAHALACSMAQASRTILPLDVNSPRGKCVSRPSSSVHMSPAVTMVGLDTMLPSVAMQLTVLRHLLLDMDHCSKTRVWFWVQQRPTWSQPVATSSTVAT